MKLILASNSPRRRELLAGLGLDFEVRVLDGIDESYPTTLPTREIAEHISRKKAAAYDVAPSEILITSDTIVVLDQQVMGKPADAADARQMLRRLSGRTHQVITGCCLKTATSERSFSVTTDVSFKNLDDSEIDYYIAHYRPFDKAGSYGIQEWIGFIGVTSINGSYFNVMGFPVQRLYEELRRLGYDNLPHHRKQ